MTIYFPWPLIIFSARGVLCCENMHDTVSANNFFRSFFCYEARSIKEANVLILWGGFSSKLLDVTADHQSSMVKNSYVIHIRGCAYAPNHPDLVDKITVHKTINECGSKTIDFRALFREVRTCLRA